MFTNRKKFIDEVIEKIRKELTNQLPEEDFLYKMIKYAKVILKKLF